MPSRGVASQESLVGRRFGRLVVEKQTWFEPAGDKRPPSRCVCICDCGERKSVKAAFLKNSNTRSCGCLRNEVTAARLVEKHKRQRAVVPGDAYVVRRLVAAYRASAQDRGLVFELQTDDVRSLIGQPCTYCGRSGVTKSSTSAGENGEPFCHNGIDRVDNAVGYIPSNCVPCCHDCNRAKLCMSVAEFKALIMRIAERISRAS